MAELVFVGLGLYDEKDISLRGLDEIKEARAVFAELYTSVMYGLSIEKLEEYAGKRISIIPRGALEEDTGRVILEQAKKGKTVLLVPGDPLIATTHVDLRIRAEKQGIRTRVVHGASIISAVIGLSGLQNYKFGRSVTIPFAEGGFASETPYSVIGENIALGLHTLCFLDIKADEGKSMTILDGLKTLQILERQKKRHVITSETFVIGIARAGSEAPAVKAGYIENVLKHDFGATPHTLIIPGKLHFMEAEALVTFAGAPEEVRERAQ